MRKSNIIIIAILLVVSVELLWLWNYLGFSLIDPIDLAIAIIWWVLVIAVIVAIIMVERRRRARIRTIFVSDGVLYNCEAGVVRLADSQGVWDYVRGMKQVLNSLDYGSEAKLSSDNPRVKFKYIVRTTRYLNDGRIWSGEVVNVSNARQSKNFSSAQDLSRILAA